MTKLTGLLWSFALVVTPDAAIGQQKADAIRLPTASVCLSDTIAVLTLFAATSEAHKKAYEDGEVVGQYTVYAMVVAAGVWIAFRAVNSLRKWLSRRLYSGS